MISVSDEHFKIITGILKKIVPDCEVRAFGSRYKWTAKDYSDLDIAVAGDGKLDWKLVAELKEAFEESDLPFRVDVLDWYGISEEFRKVIEEGYEVIWRGRGRLGVSCSGWKEVKLGDAINFNPRESFSKGEVAKKIAMEKLNPYSRKINGFEMAEFNGGTKFRNGDTLVARITPCLENGKTAQVTILDDNEIGFGSTEYIVLREKVNKTDNNFIYYFSISPRFRDIAIKSMVGTSGRQRVQQDVLENVMFLLPPLVEQKAIAETLSCLDDKIELNNRMNKNLEEMAQAIFKSWFVDFEPFQDGEFEDSELGRIPKGWRVETVDSISKDIVCGKTPSTKDKANYGDYMPFITIPDMHGNVYVVKTERYLSQQGVNVQLNKTLPNNSIAVSCIATPGLVVLTSEKSQTNQQINSVVCENNISHFYIFLCMKNYSDKIKDLGSGGSTTLNLNKTQFSKIKLIIPTEKVMTEFHKQVEFLFDLILENQNQIDDLIQVRDTLLPKLMSGEIRVPIEEA